MILRFWASVPGVSATSVKRPDTVGSISKRSESNRATSTPSIRICSRATSGQRDQARMLHHNPAALNANPHLVAGRGDIDDLVRLQAQDRGYGFLQFFVSQ